MNGTVVEFGVAGAWRIVRRVYDTLEEAEARAARWRSSNSTGEYWAEVTPDASTYILDGEKVSA